jgi:hypothetical protein
VQAVVCLLVAIAIRPEPTQAQTAPPTIPLPAVTVDLNAAAIGQRIDFDVPVVLSGAISKEVTAVELTVKRLEGRVRPKKGEAAPQPCEAARARVLATASWRRLAGSEAEIFSMVLPPLEPNLDFCFEFTVVRGLSPEEKKIVTDAARRATRAAYEELGADTSLNLNRADELRKAVARAVVDGVRPLHLLLRRIGLPARRDHGGGAQATGAPRGAARRNPAHGLP